MAEWFINNIDTFYIWLVNRADTFGVELLKIHEVLMAMISFMHVPNNI